MNVHKKSVHCVLNWSKLNKKKKSSVSFFFSAVISVVVTACHCLNHQVTYGVARLQKNPSVWVSIHYCNVHIRSLVYQDKLLVMLILQSGAIKSLQKKRAQRDDVIKRTPVKLQTHENNVETWWKYCISVMSHVLIWGRLQITCFHLPLIFFRLFSGAEAWVDV